MLNKIVCIGDSITKGKVWNENDRRPYITEKSYPNLLNKLINIDVLNNGICDITSEEVIKHIGEDINFEKNNIIIVEIGGNDCNLNWREIRKAPYGNHDAIVPLQKFSNNLQYIVNIIKERGAIPVLLTLPPLDGDKYYNLLKKVFGDGIKQWIDDNGGIFKWQEKYSNVITNIAQITNTYIADIRKSFLTTKNYTNYLSIDGIHPNEEGYKLIASSLSSTLVNIFELGKKEAFV